MTSINPYQDDSTILQWGARNGFMEVVERLILEPGIDPSANDNYAIQWATRDGNLEIIERLLQDPRVDPNALHRSEPHPRININKFSKKSLMILATKLSKDFPADSHIISWKPLIDKYREELFDLFNMFRDNKDNELNHFHGDEMINLVIE